MRLGFQHHHPGGMAENSPAFQRRDSYRATPGPGGTAENDCASRPSGTESTPCTSNRSGIGLERLPASLLNTYPRLAVRSVLGGAELSPVVVAVSGCARPGAQEVQEDFQIASPIRRSNLGQVLCLLNGRDRARPAGEPDFRFCGVGLMMHGIGNT